MPHPVSGKSPCATGGNLHKKTKKTIGPFEVVRRLGGSKKKRRAEGCWKMGGEPINTYDLLGKKNADTKCTVDAREERGDEGAAPK